MTTEDLFLSSCIDDNFICIKIDPRQKRKMGAKRVLQRGTESSYKPDPLPKDVIFSM